MSLSKKIREASLDDLVARYSEQHTLTPAATDLLTAINLRAAENDIYLAHQSETLISDVLQAVNKAVQEKKQRNTALDEIYELISQGLNKEGTKNRKDHKNQGTFDTNSLHLRSKRTQFQDHDMTLFTPKSWNNIEVLAVVIRNNKQSEDLAVEGIKTAIHDPKKKHIIIAVGPGHYRLISITKPAPGEQYQIDLFGPYGTNDARVIQGMALKWLKQCGINQAQIAKPKLEAPKHTQTDGYACGDYTCAHSHRKMKEFGAPTSAYDEHLIAALDAQGNRNDALREVFRQKSQDPAYSTKAATKPVVVQDKPETTKPIVVKSKAVTAKPTPVQQTKTETPKALDEKEQQVLNANFIKTPKNEATRDNYRETLTSLISSRDTIFQKAKELKKKSNLSDEELAIQLQSEELENAFKPK